MTRRRPPEGGLRLTSPRQAICGHDSSPQIIAGRDALLEAAARAAALHAGLKAVVAGRWSSEPALLAALARLADAAATWTRTAAGRAA